MTDHKEGGRNSAALSLYNENHAMVVWSDLRVLQGILICLEKKEGFRIFNFIMLLIPRPFVKKPQKRLSQNVGGKDRERKRKRDQKLLHGQGCCAQKSAAKIDKTDLYDQDHCHDRNENGIFSKPCVQAQSIGPCVEAIEDR